MIGQQLLRESLVAGDHGPARIAAGIAQPDKLQVNDNVLIEKCGSREFLKQIERKVWLEFVNCLTKDRKIIVDTEYFDVVPEFPERDGNIIFSLPGSTLDFFVTQTFDSFQKGIKAAIANRVKDLGL